MSRLLPWLSILEYTLHACTARLCAAGCRAMCSQRLDALAPGTSRAEHTAHVRVQAGNN